MKTIKSSLFGDVAVIETLKGDDRDVFICQTKDHGYWITYKTGGYFVSGNWCIYSLDDARAYANSLA